MDLSSIALQGINQAEALLEAAASSVANAGAASSGGANVDVVDVAAQMATMESAAMLVEMNLSTLKTSNEIQQNALDILA
jgi:hypothetical protein